MSGEALYERYKDALKRGHVASLRGRLEEALTAYAEAATIAPERPTPHTSAGTALMRRKRPGDALRHYGVALQLAPRDEAALLGRAQALVALGRPREAANTYDTLAEARADAGKLADAVEAARHGLEVAEGRERRRMLASLIERLRQSEPGDADRAALEQALQVLDGTAVSPAKATRAAGAATKRTAPAADAPAADAPAAEPEPVPAVAPEPIRSVVVVEPAEPEIEIAPEAPAEPPAEPPIRAALDRDLPDDVDVDALARAADAAVDEGVPGPAVARLLDLAAAHRRAGRIEAALDACYVGLSLDPDDVDLHLALVRLYGDRGWSTLAVEKLDLLERLAAFDDDADATARVAAARSAPG